MSDVLIIGGGLIGLATARELHRSGVRKITILERGTIGRESSYAAAGMLAGQAETDRADEFFGFCRASNQLYADFSAALFDETGVDIELDRHGTLYIAFTENDLREIRQRFEWQTRAGLQVERLTSAETRKIEPFVSPDVKESLFFPNDWQVENRLLLKALRKYAELNGIQLRENTSVERVLIENGKVCGVQNATDEFLAETVVLATGAWTSLIEADGLKMPSVKPIRGQMIGFQTAKRLFSKVIYSPRGYLVPRADGRILVGATVEDVGFEKGVTGAGTEFLRENAFEISPSLTNLEISEKWSGLRPQSSDFLPIIGSFPQVENLYLATAHYRNGILLAPLTAKILAEKIAQNKDSVYFSLFGPQRFTRNGLRLLNTAR